MRDDYEKLFRGLRSVEPPRRLYAMILACIEFEKRRAARVRFACTGVVTLLSLIALVPAFQYVAQEFHLSAFYPYLSLLFWDGGGVAAYWKEFTLSLVESLPLLGVTVFLSTIFVLLGSLKLAAKNMQTGFALNHLSHH